ncbi:hypothetical protein [Psychroserpens ponticola]|uniref:Uncharacterized protein n=1 Tax=Psychroserpens ponticola TaxID=2932268 RepID=A0ABY7RZE9_9FLAO|nr:hypothetical protein [Psychroserpens ponticola]WCO01065.1 hypothetical protein MUN68_013455 [Psychroserpens ponticola]
MIKKIVFWSLGIIASLAILFIFYLIFIVKIGPVDTSKKNSIEVSGVIDSLYEGGVKDLVIKLKDDSNIYYINRALENGFDLDDVNTTLLGKEITLWHSKSWNGSDGGHMMQLKHKDSIYFTEWKTPLPSNN